MASFYLADQCCELLLFLLALKEFSNRSASACVCHIGQLTDAIVQFLVRTNHEGVLVHFDYCDGVFGEAPNTKTILCTPNLRGDISQEAAQTAFSGKSTHSCRPEMPTNQGICCGGACMPHVFWRANPLL